MSDTLLIEWFDQLLFGKKDKHLLPLPKVLHFLVARLLANGISWKEVSQQEGLTQLLIHVKHDLDSCLVHLDKTHEPTFHTSLIHNFFNQLVTVLARQTPPLFSTDNDESTLQAILSGEPGPFQYDSASFWGELVRQWLNHERPLPKVMPLPPSTTKDEKRAYCLYDTTCQTRGERLDPLSTVMVPFAEYVNPVHWKSDILLAHFLKEKPEHALSKSVKQLVSRTIHQVLEGTFPSCLDRNDAALDGFLQNVASVDLVLPKVEVPISPPLLIDVFHRLLAMVHMDHLWETCSVSIPRNVTNGEDLLHLTHQLILAERQNQLLLQQIPLD